VARGMKEILPVELTVATGNRRSLTFSAGMLTASGTVRTKSQMKKSEILRGRNSFKRVALTGKRIDAGILRCSFCPNGDGGVQVGFKVPSRNLNAVKRNRIRRLMREAFTVERGKLDEALGRSTTGVEMMIFFKGAKGVAVERLTLAAIRNDIRSICHSIAGKL
jgi:ribonuclease P protein component